MGTRPRLRRAAMLGLLGLVATACGLAETSGSRPGGGADLANPDARFFWDEPGVDHESLVPLDEIISGGPGPDGIPPIDEPRFIAPAEAGWLDKGEPVIALDVEGDVRAYPLQILIWHEIVNDTVGGVPVSVTYCPLCNSAIVYDRRVAGQETTFGTSGRLYHSDLVMYDRQTKSMWPQIMGKAVVGPRIGTELVTVPSQVVSFGELREAHPEARVLSRETGFDRDYGRNPYEGYDSSPRPFLFRGDIPAGLQPIARVVGVRTDDGAKAYAIDALRARGKVAALNDRIRGTQLVVFFTGEARSAVDESEIATSRRVGSTGVFSSKVGRRVLTFEVTGDRIMDRETGSTWDIFGLAVAGPLKGERLQALNKVDTFWFAWSVFLPGTGLWNG